MVRQSVTVVTRPLPRPYKLQSYDQLAIFNGSIGLLGFDVPEVKSACGVDGGFFLGGILNAEPRGNLG
jgi:hypothetical protein